MNDTLDFPLFSTPIQNSVFKPTDLELSAILRLMHSQFSLPLELVHNSPKNPGIITNYHILQWSGAYLKSQNHHGHIRKDNQVWKVIFHHCSAISCYTSPQCKLSFRKYKGHCIVLITPWHFSAKEIAALEYKAATRGE